MPKNAISPLPDALAQAYHQWHKNSFAPRADDFATLATGQQPETMVISCCDSRVQASALFQVTEGDFFMHRNIANFVPPPDAVPENHATASAVEYAVKVLKVKRIIVLGHAGCGGMRACMDMCAGDGSDDDGFLSAWIGLLKPAYERLGLSGHVPDRLGDMERENVKYTLENLRAYDFVTDALAAGRLTLHGLWHDIGTGVLYAHDEKADSFERV